MAADEWKHPRASIRLGTCWVRIAGGASSKAGWPGRRRSMGWREIVQKALGRRPQAPPKRPQQLVLGTLLSSGKPLRLVGKEARRHLLIIGTTGAGKSKFIVTQALQVMKRGHSLICLDPAGDLADDILMGLWDSGFFRGGEHAFRKLLYVDWRG